jgi:hypothetical protein
MCFFVEGNAFEAHHRCAFLFQAWPLIVFAVIIKKWKYFFHFFATVNKRSYNMNVVQNNRTKKAHKAK